MDVAKLNERVNRVGLPVMGVLTTLVVILGIVKRWSLYQPWMKTCAILFVAMILFFPALALWTEEHRKRKVGRAQIIFWGYLFLLMATILFSD